jgi:DNA-binding beta-propeller fold protein YncE
VQNVVPPGAAQRPWSVAVDRTNGYVYWTEYSRSGSTLGGISRSNLDGSAIVNLLTPAQDPSSPSGLALDLVHGKMYWTDSWNNSPIRRANLDGSGVEAIAAAASARDIALDVAGGKMYWTNLLDGTIRRANLDGSNPQTLLGSTGAEPYGIALDLLHDRMYWAEARSNLIRRANLDGTGVEDLLSVDVPVAIALDVMGNRLYWSQQPLDLPAAIYRAHLDGAQMETLVTGLGAPYDLTIDGVPPGRVPEPGTALLLAIGMVAAVAARRT